MSVFISCVFNAPVARGTPVLHTVLFCMTEVCLMVKILDFLIFSC
jgi:hypothetical protein